jgi:solute carrier family 25 citrate transporter 1
MAKVNEKSLLAGGIAGMVSQTITWPLEYVKTLKQIHRNNNNVSKLILSEVKKKGILTTMTGLSPQLISSIPRASVRFYAYNNFNNFFNNNDKKNNLINFGAGLFGGAVEAVTVMTPAEVIKVKSIKNPNKKSSFIIGNILKNQGYSGLYQGVLPTALRQSTTQGFSFLAFNYTKPKIENNPIMKLNSSVSSLLAGIIGGSFAVALNNPIDSIKTQMQASKNNNSLIKNINDIYQSNGIRGFYKGGLFRISRVGPLHGITFFTYDLVSKLL